MSDISNQAWHEQVRSATEMTRAMTASKATRISPSAMAEVLVALHDYWDALQSTELSERSKGIYLSMADNFVRWMRNDFVPGRRMYPPRDTKRHRDEVPLPIRTNPGVHGTHERWIEGCDCNECRHAMCQRVSRSAIPSSLASTLHDMLVFRRNGKELWLTSNTLKKDTVRSDIDALVRLGVLSEMSTERPGTFLLHCERLPLLEPDAPHA